MQDVQDMIRSIAALKKGDTLTINDQTYIVKDVLKPEHEDDEYPHEQFGADILLQAEDGKKLTLALNENHGPGGQKAYVVKYGDKIVVMNNRLIDRNFSLL